MVDGLQGGGAVKVGIIYDEDLNEGRVYFDLFQIDHGTTVCIQEVAEDGVKTCLSQDGQFRLIERGMSILDRSVRLPAQAILRANAGSS